ncbi:hypothetical protein BDW72DRAFT_184779 [Aspergillus terricola var. indicus]
MTRLRSEERIQAPLPRKLSPKPGDPYPTPSITGDLLGPSLAGDMMPPHWTYAA